MSPVPKKKKEDLMNFMSAIDKVIKGKKITRKEWLDKDVYGFIQDKVLCIHTKKKNCSWVLSELDIKAKDWMLV